MGHGLRGSPPHEAAQRRREDLQQARLRHPEQHHAHRGRVEVGEHVRGVGTGGHAQPEQRVAPGGERHERRPGPRGEPPVRAEEPELLHERPHEHHVEQPPPLLPGGHADQVHGHGAREQEPAPHPPHLLMHTHETGCQGLADQIGGQEPQRHPHPGQRERHQLVRRARHERRCGPERQRAPQHGGRLHEPQGPLPHVLPRGHAPRTTPPPRPRRGRPAHHEEQRHDLQEPRGPPVPGLQRGHEHRADLPGGRVPGDGDQEDVEAHHGDHARHTSGVHGGVAVRGLGGGRGLGANVVAHARHSRMRPRASGGGTRCWGTRGRAPSGGRTAPAGAVAAGRGPTG